jgi:hypothetical protein
VLRARGAEKKGLSLQEVREEIISLFDEGIAEQQDGSPEATISILIEAQLLLCDTVQNEISRMHTTPPLAPLANDSFPVVDTCTHVS